ncbi:MAG: TldD/PmbA family protein [Polyangiaceae bacterium]|nr:TldD/PmbA family protein [Polyangiaceae bacterium]
MPDEREELLEIAQKVVRKARDHVEVAEVSIGSSWDLSAKVRLGKTELVEEAGGRGASLRVIKDGRLAMTSTSDLSESGLSLLVDDAVELADLAEKDDLLGPAPVEDLARGPFQDLDLFDQAVSAIDADEALERARRAEKAALDADKRITLSEGATFSRTSSTRVMVLSGGFEGTQRGSYASLNVVPLAEESDGTKRRGYYWTAKRHLEDLEPELSVGREATRRTLQKLGASKIDTKEMPVIFDNDSSRSILSTFAGCLMGGALWRKSSYLLGRLNSEVANPLVEIIDDPLVQRGPGSRPYDGEGLTSRANQIVKSGKLQSYILDCYSGRKLNLPSTASASRGGGSVGPSTSNLIMQAGKLSVEELIESTEEALLVTEMMGFGFNGITGDFSRGAAGFLIRGGKIVQPVNEVTISANLDDMMKNIDAIANDLELKTSVAAPSFRISKMTVSGN